jgi:SRSO17 transposase
MAALTAPAEVSVQHQRLLHFAGEADWSDARVLMKVRQLVVPVIEDGEPIKAWIIDDTSYPKQGISSSRHTVHRGLRLPDLPTGEDSPLLLRRDSSDYSCS